MPTKGHRNAALVRTHSRSSSATKLPINLQFTQKKLVVVPHPPHRSLPALTTFLQPRPKQQQHPPPTKQRPGFHIASPGEEEEDDWVSSESAAATPNHHNDSDSDLDSPASNDVPKTPEQPTLPRVATARLSDYTTPMSTDEHRTAMATTTTTPRADHAPPMPTERAAERPPPTRTEPPPAPHPLHRRHASARGLPHQTTRPTSTHSVAAKPELRPHPLIRGQSVGLPTPKPSPLLPLAVTLEADAAGQISASPSSQYAFPLSPASPHRAGFGRRTSVSSARSVATVPPPQASFTLPRHRTLSTLSVAPSSAALSSLTHLPAVSRPPTPQMIAFFPPANPHVHVDAIHPLLPPPYIHNHLTVLARRTPIREAFDRVVRARQGCAR
ncbi:hypothetical protein B0H10DRAFT_2079507 [Mycena sp. CBHHK59/15]|nr:hypothetical protein B0H10DRAFT_2079507 [Mycena sp. CBHHK59/15]